ncbi:protein adenylyltransferase SelO [Salinicola avicenniae]|uniref:protein adenylyltransferase SelO n=1 Tax=Salinicola avicenniae TaxID=2916836 RepID=UPI002073F76E|nr:MULTISPECIES: YdiU family protein [unclassified Salinicola]
MTLESLTFDNVWSRFPEDFFVRVAPTAWRETRVLDVSPTAALRLGLDIESIDPDRLAALMSGERLLAGMDPLAQKYTGHQFGTYNPALGDGRGLLLGEALTPHGPVDLHLKGAGQTPYSRFGDGRAVLRSSIREYLAGEAMSGLRIPTTQALAVAVNGEKVMRERVEPGATLLRLADSHVRFGHFEWLYQQQRHDDLERLMRHVIDRHRSDLAQHEAPMEAMFQDAVTRTAELIARWQAYGFVHAVMNTDNMSILGLTLDYGPYAFMDRYEPDLTPNHTDSSGRYAFDQQPGVALWNLTVLGQSLTPLIAVERLREILDSYEPTLQAAYAILMRARLGLETEQDDDGELIDAWLDLLARSRADFHRSFRALADQDVVGGLSLSEEIDDPGLADWLERYRRRLAMESRSETERLAAMRRVNPLYVLRTHLAQQVIEAAQAGDTVPLQTFRELLASPFEARPGMAAWSEAPPRNAPPVCLSCSS